MEELQVIQKNGSIECNFSEIKADLQNMMSAYTSLEITEEGTKEAKSDLATLRKIRKAVDDKRKEVKKTFMQPYTEFEDSVKDLLSVIDEPIEMIDGKLKEFESKRKEEKLNHLHELYNEQIGEFGDYLTYDKAFNPKWLNSTYSDKNIRFDISEMITKVRSDLDIIKTLNSEIEEELLKVYASSGNDLATAIKRNNDYLEAKNLAEKKVSEETKVAEKIDDSTDAEVGDDVFTIRIHGVENIAQVKDFLNFSEIEYEEITYKEV